MARKKKKVELYITFPPHIHMMALDFCRTRLNEEESKRLSRLKQEKEEKLQRRFRLQNGLADAKHVFDWVKVFRNTDIGQELMRKSHQLTGCQGVIFYDGRVEGEKWVGLVSATDGLFLAKVGRMSQPTRVKSAVDLALAVDPKILREACKWIESGQVWKCIEWRFGYLNEE